MLILVNSILSLSILLLMMCFFTPKEKFRIKIKNNFGKEEFYPQKRVFIFFYINFVEYEYIRNDEKIKKHVCFNSLIEAFEFIDRKIFTQ